MRKISEENLLITQGRKPAAQHRAQRCTESMAVLAEAALQSLLLTESSTSTENAKFQTTEEILINDKTRTESGLAVDLIKEHQKYTLEKIYL